ncbi:MAG: nuclear transport factor 2 family protein [Sporocytophaga sp.]|uniref:nuclear transport factor 2 family protein n=1 Tax=Sporocytophaga sp. TaxID=2231183 RepID=UPI001B2AB078|nr:nuclear transport factor 2 family protein [Sporocytophaga sp.]MBO9702855.1 nuclear transport factor 2 family protein [Sporocytophaga sp.]
MQSTDQFKILKEIEEQENKLLTAVMKSDVSALNELIHDDLIFNLPDGQTATKAMDLDAYTTGKMKVSEISASEREIHIIAQSAVVAVTIELKGSFQDLTIDGQYRYLRIWQLHQDKWQIIAGSCTLIK